MDFRIDGLGRAYGPPTGFSGTVPFLLFNEQAEDGTTPMLAACRSGHLDIVSANAGIESFAPAEQLTDEQFTDMLQVNLMGVWHAAKAAVPHLRAAGGGSMIFTSSFAGLAPLANNAHYTAAKHGVVGLMRVMATELAPDNIRVNTVNPTMVNTDMVQNDAIYRLFRPDLENPGKQDFADAAVQMNALPIPWVEAVDISNALLFLASDEARYITGVALPVDAGAAVK